MEFQSAHVSCQCLTVLIAVSLLVLFSPTTTIAGVTDKRLIDLIDALTFENEVETFLKEEEQQEVRHQQVVEHLREETEPGCHMREYFQPMDKSLVLPDGESWYCYGNVTVMVCLGSCDTSEIADYKPPYTISNEAVCMYTGRVTRMVPLENCHPNHPDPMVEVFDATGCVCQKCNPENTYCEHLNG